MREQATTSAGMKTPLLIDDQPSRVDIVEHLYRTDGQSLAQQRELNSALVGFGKTLASLETGFPILIPP